MLLLVRKARFILKLGQLCVCIALRKSVLVLHMGIVQKKVVKSMKELKFTLAIVDMMGDPMQKNYFLQYYHRVAIHTLCTFLWHESP